MALTIHDPGRIGLRRGIRAAIAMPIALAITLNVVDDTVGAVFAALGTAALLITADFAGTWQRRLKAYLITGVIGTPIIVIGWAASQTIVSAVLVTLVVTFAIAFVSLLRGTYAVGAPAIMLVFVVAVTVGGSRDNLPDYLGAWWIAVVVCTIAALTIVPRDVRGLIRQALGDTLHRGAVAVRAVWVEPVSIPRMAAAIAELTSSVERLQSAYDGNPFRPSGANSHDRSLTLLVNHVNSAALLLSGAVDSTSAPVVATRLDVSEEVAADLADALDGVAHAALDPRVIPTASALDEARARHRNAVEGWVLSSRQAGVDPDTIASTVRSDHLLRMAAVMGEQMVALGRELNGADDEGLDHEPPIPQAPWSALALAHLNLGSPWLRTALRTAIGLALAILVVQLTGLEHGFWVMLGVISVLRYDGAGTRRLAIPAIVGTVVGVLIGTVVIFAVGDHFYVLWCILPLGVFLAAWAPVAISFPVGQAAFSGFILIALGIIVWPPNLTTGLIRIQDIIIGIVVALAVGLLMWPRGALGALHSEIAVGLRASASFLSIALRGLTEVVDEREVAHARLEARAAAQRASDTYDMAIMQRGSGAKDALQWASMATSTHLLLAVSRILGLLATDPPILAAAPSTIPPVKEAGRISAEHWAEVIADMEADKEYTPTPTRVEVPLEGAPLPQPVDVVDTASARGYVAAVWTIDWLEHLDRLAGAPATQPVPATHD